MNTIEEMNEERNDILERSNLAEKSKKNLIAG
jgi:hypothetical protein